MPQESITAMSLSDADLSSIQALCRTDNLARLASWIAVADEDSKDWLGRIHAAMMAFLELSAQDIDALSVRQGAASVAFAGLLKHLGERDELKPHLDEIQSIGRLYLSLLGFRSAHLIFVNQLPPQPEALNPPGTVDLEYRLAVQLLEAAQKLLDASPQMRPLSTHERCGLLIISLALRDGALSTAEITMALREISAGRIIRHRTLCYVVGPIAKNGIHLRRLHLSALSVALGMKTPPMDLTPALLNRCLEAARKRLKTPAGKDGLKLKTLLSAAQHYLRLADYMPQFVVDYAQQYIQSDSVEEVCFARLLGVTPHPAAIAHEQALRQQVTRGKTQVMPYQHSGAIREIASACTTEKHKEDARKSALSVAHGCLARTDLSVTERLVIEWAIWMIDTRKLAPSTCSGHMVTLYRPLQASLSQLDMSLLEQSPDQWDALVDDMTRDLNRRNNLFDAVVEMTRFLNFKTEGGFRHSGYSEPALVNAYVISDVEKDEALQLLEINYGSSDPDLAKQAQFALELAHHLGNRRWEYLGLTFQDVVGTKDPILKVRNNSVRWVKTDASNRVVPLKLVWHSPLYASWRQQAELHGGYDPWDSILETRGFPLAKHERRMFDAINAVLYQVTGSPEVTYHTLRHTAVCRMMLALYWEELQLDDLCEFDYFREIAEAAPRIRDILLRSHTRHFAEHKTVSAIVGHLSFATTAGHYFHFMDLMRWAILRQVNQASLLPDKPAWVTALALDADLNADTPSEALDLLEQKFPDSFLRHTDVAPQRLDFSGLGLREKLRLIGEVVLKAPEDRDSHLARLIPDDARRAKYLDGLATRLDYIHDLLAQKQQWSTKHGAILIMPTERTVQMEILGIINRVSSCHDTNRKLQELSVGLLIALKHLKSRHAGSFAFKSVSEAQQILAPVTTLLDMTKTEIDCWYYYTKRVGKSQLKQKEKEMRVASLAELPENHRGELIVRFAFGEGTKTSPQRTLIWTMSSIFCAYGSERVINQ